MFLCVVLRYIYRYTLCNFFGYNWKCVLVCIDVFVLKELVTFCLKFVKKIECIEVQSLLNLSDPQPCRVSGDCKENAKCYMGQCRCKDGFRRNNGECEGNCFSCCKFIIYQLYCITY